MSLSTLSQLGVQAAAQRVESSAVAISNPQITVSSTYEDPDAKQLGAPQNIVQFPIEPSNGSQTIRQDSSSAFIYVYQPFNPDADANGIVKIANVDYPEEIGKINMARYEFDGNLKVLETAKEFVDTVLDITA